MRTAGLLLAWAFAAFAQNPPADFLDLYSSLQQKLTDFDATVTAQWDGSKPPVAFCAELLTANSNRGVALIGPNALVGLQLELNRLHANGVTAVSMAIGFPVMYQPFYTWNGDANDYQQFVSFYRQAAAYVRAAGLRLVVHAGPVYTGVFSAGSGLNVDGYYKTLTSSSYISARARNIVNIALQIQPDYLVVAQEPDNEAAITGQSSIATVKGSPPW